MSLPKFGKHKDVPDILLVEEDEPTRNSLLQRLEGEDYGVMEASPGEDVADAVAAKRPDLVIMDLRTHDEDGIDQLKRLRERSDVPIVALSVEDRKGPKVRALDAGADDFVTKPFDIDELLARVRAVLRRAPRTPSRPAKVVTGDLEVDLEARQVRRAGQPIHLTPTELGLLEELVTNPGRLLTHQQLLQRVWGPNYGTESHYLRVYIAQLRRKLGDSAQDPRLIVTEPGIGYRWIAESQTNE